MFIHDAWLRLAESPYRSKLINLLARLDECLLAILIGLNRVEKPIDVLSTEKNKRLSIRTERFLVDKPCINSILSTVIKKFI